MKQNIYKRLEELEKIHAAALQVIANRAAVRSWVRSTDSYPSSFPPLAGTLGKVPMLAAATKCIRYFPPGCEWVLQVPEN